MKTLFILFQACWPLAVFLLFVACVAWMARLLASATAEYEGSLDLEMQHSCLHDGPITDAEPRRHPLRPRAPSTAAAPVKPSLGLLRLERMSGQTALKLPR